MTDIIEKRIRLEAPIGRVWRALTDHREFGTWFHVELDGPFQPGRPVSGRITYPGYEHLTWQATVERMEPERLFSFRWHPYAVDPDHDYSGEPTTLVEFQLEPDGGRTLLSLRESGFDALPAHRRGEAFMRNEDGWSIQMRNVAAHVDPTAV